MYVYLMERQVRASVIFPMVCIPPIIIIIIVSIIIFRYFWNKNNATKKSVRGKVPFCQRLPNQIRFSNSTISYCFYTLQIVILAAANGNIAYVCMCYFHDILFSL